MELELIRTKTDTKKKIYSYLYEHAETCEIIIPDYMPDAKKITAHQAKIIIKERTCTDGKASLMGYFEFDAVFSSEENEPFFVSSKVPFHNEIKITESDSDAVISDDTYISDVSVNLLNSRKIGFRANAHSFISIYKNECLEIPVDFPKSPEIMTLKEKREIFLPSVFSRKGISLEDDLTIPDEHEKIKEIFLTRTYLKEDDIKLISNKVILKGSAVIFLLYQCEDDEKNLKTMETELPFSLIIDAEGVSEDDELSLSFDNPELNVSLQNSDSGNTINVSIFASVFIKTYKKTSLEFISDAFSKTDGLELKFQKYKTENRVGTKNIALNIKDSISPNDKNSVSRIISAYSDISKIRITYKENRAFFSGEILASALCSNKDGSHFTTEKHIPFTLEISDEKSENTLIEYDIPKLFTSYNLNMSGDIELRITSAFAASFISNDEINMIISAEKDENAAKNIPSSKLFACFPLNGERIWDVAKRYRASPDDILCANKLSCTAADMAEAGKMMLVPRLQSL